MNLFSTCCLSLHMLLLNDPEAVDIIMFTILQQKIITGFSQILQVNIRFWQFSLDC